MNSVTSAQLQSSSARANTCACTRTPLQQADAFVVARLLQLRNRTRCSSCWVPWVFWVRADKWRVSSSRPSRLRMYFSRRLYHGGNPSPIFECNYYTFLPTTSTIRHSLRHRVKNVMCAIFYRLTSRYLLPFLLFLAKIMRRES